MLTYAGGAAAPTWQHHNLEIQSASDQGCTQYNKPQLTAVSIVHAPTPAVQQACHLNVAKQQLLSVGVPCQSSCPRVTGAQKESIKLVSAI
jgi:hypothetical protein